MRIKVTFTECEVNSQAYAAGDDEHMVSRVFLTIEEANGKKHEGLHVALKQTAGADFETGPIEVGWPVGYKGPFNHHEFSKAAQRYFRELIGASGTKFRMGPGASHIGLIGVRIKKTTVVEFEAREGEDGW